MSVAFLLGGCSTTHVADQGYFAGAEPGPIVIAEVRPADPPRSDRPGEPEDADEAVTADARARALLPAARTRAQPLIRQAVEDMGVPVVITPDRFQRIELGQGQTDAARVRDGAFLEDVRKSSDATALLSFEITDFGRTPKAWKYGVVAFEVVTTLGTATVAYLRPATRAIAGAYLLQETIEETVEAYAGFWALDRVLCPVRVEARLTDLRTARPVWEDSATGFADLRISRLVRKIPDEEKASQLDDALKDAVRKLMKALGARVSEGRKTKPSV